MCSRAALDGALFVQWVGDWLAPTLPPDTIVILDNLSVHRHPGVRAAIEAVGCHLRFLPPYSPDFNPIELIFAKLKTHLRGAEARAFEPLVEEIGRGLATITPGDLRACYRHCGYRLADDRRRYTKRPGDRPGALLCAFVLGESDGQSSRSFEASGVPTGERIHASNSAVRRSSYSAQ